ncbi:MAG: NAD-binding protein [Pseudomonadota bacterium]
MIHYLHTSVHLHYAVRKERKNNIPIFYGDASHITILKHANINMAKFLAIGINDPIATRRIIKVTRKLNSQTDIIVRTPYSNEVKKLFELGASQVISEEFETSIEIYTRGLRDYLISEDKINKFTSELRKDCYDFFKCT